MFIKNIATPQGINPAYANALVHLYIMNQALAGLEATPDLVKNQLEQLNLTKALLLDIKGKIETEVIHAHEINTRLDALIKSKIDISRLLHKQSDTTIKTVIKKATLFFTGITQNAKKKYAAYLLSVKKLVHEMQANWQLAQTCYNGFYTELVNQTERTDQEITTVIGKAYDEYFNLTFKNMLTLTLLHSTMRQMVRLLYPKDTTIPPLTITIPKLNAAQQHELLQHNKRLSNIEGL